MIVFGIVCFVSRFRARARLRSQARLASFPVFAEAADVGLSAEVYSVANFLFCVLFCALDLVKNPCHRQGLGFRSSRLGLLGLFN